MPKLALVMPTSSHILWLFGMTTWGVGGIHLNVQTKLEHDDDLALVVQMIRSKYAKALRSTWMECD